MTWGARIECRMPTYDYVQTKPWMGKCKTLYLCSQCYSKIKRGAKIERGQKQETDTI